MSAHTLPIGEETLEGNGSPLPTGWMAKWSPEHNAWYYVFLATGATQWEHPEAQHKQQQYQGLQDPDPNVPAIENQPTTMEVGMDTQVTADGDRGLGKTALAMGGGFLAGSTLRNKLEKHHESHGQQNALGKMAQSVAIAGAGAVGAKIMGLFGNKQQEQHPAPPVQTATYTHTQTQTHYYPVYVPGPQVSPPPLYYGQHPQSTSSYAHNPAVETVGATPDIQSLGSPWSLQSPGSTLQIKGDSLVEHFGDPWPEVERKMFNVLYSYGDRPMELLAADTTSSNIEIKHEAISKRRMEFCQAPPSPIIAVVWGYENVLTVAQKVEDRTAGERR
ncbi:hypothetical protein FPRO04_12651 [Fusarium proliferatum]|nr:hypothetical protein FPRO04_12651 [Fusarium proliferatum]